MSIPQTKPGAKPNTGTGTKPRRRKSKVSVRKLAVASRPIPTTHTSIRLSDADKRKLAALAHAMHGGITKSAVVRLLVRTAYDKLVLKQTPQPAIEQPVVEQEIDA